MSRVFTVCLAILLVLANPGMAVSDVVEQLRLHVPSDQREIWLSAERSTWQPWLEAQSGFLGRDLYWDPDREEALLLIRWASREQWKAITDQDVESVQATFDAAVKTALHLADDAPSPFPLVAEGELQRQPLTLP